MIEAAAIFLLIFTAVTTETALGNLGLAVPLTACAAFHLGGVMGWRGALPVAAVAGLWLDLLFGRFWLGSSLALAVIAQGGRLWPSGERAPPLAAFMLPGAATGVIAILLPGLGATWASGIPAPEQCWRLAVLVIAAGAMGALMLPALIAMLDQLAGWFGLPQYRPANMDRRHRDLAGKSHDQSSRNER